MSNILTIQEAIERQVREELDKELDKTFEDFKEKINPVGGYVGIPLQTGSGTNTIERPLYQVLDDIRSVVFDKEFPLRVNREVYKVLETIGKVRSLGE